MVGADFLTALYQIAFNHDAFDQFLDVRGHQTAVEDFFDNTDLLFLFFTGIGMIGINDDCRIFQISFFIHFQKKLEILIVIIGNGISMFVYSAS